MKEILESNQGALIGGVVGLLCAIFFITIGFFKAILVVTFIILGSFGGYYIKKSGLIEGCISKK